MERQATQKGGRSLSDTKPKRLAERVRKEQSPEQHTRHGKRRMHFAYSCPVFTRTEKHRMEAQGPSENGDLTGRGGLGAGENGPPGTEANGISQYLPFKKCGCETHFRLKDMQTESKRMEKDTPRGSKPERKTGHDRVDVRERNKHTQQHTPRYGGRFEGDQMGGRLGVRRKGGRD